MDSCIFCKIVSGEMPSAKWWENEDFIAILDINPNIQGATLLIPKKHEPSDYEQASTETLQKSAIALKHPISILKKHFNTPRVGIVVEGVGVDHLHFKLYPFIGYNEKMAENQKREYFEQYPGYISTKLGPKADTGELEKLAGQLIKQ